jgi:uncharacterized protein YjbI with pentapeptide repeats
VSNQRAIVDGQVRAARSTGARATVPTVLRRLRLCLVVAIAIVTAGSALACSCGSDLPGGLPQASFNAASVIFRGTMHGTEHVQPTNCDKHSGGYDCRPYLAGVFSVEHVLKGSPVTLIKVGFANERCAPGLPEVGETDWVAAWGDAERGYSMGECMYFVPPADANSPLVETIADYQRRRKRLNDAVEQGPSGRSALMALAAFYTETNDRLESIRTLDRLLAVEPLHREATILKARQLADGPDQNAVLDTLAPYLAAHPDDHDALHRRVLALVRLDRLGDVPADWRDFTELRGWYFDFSNASLNGASFRDDQLYNTSFAEAQLRGADFSDVEMWDNNFAGADLTGAVMAQANLGQTDFRGAVLSGADLTGADIVYAKLDQADLRGAVLRGAVVTGVYVSRNLEGALYDDATIWPAGFDPVAAGAIKQQ